MTALQRGSDTTARFLSESNHHRFVFFLSVCSRRCVTDGFQPPGVHRAGCPVPPGGKLSWNQPFPRNPWSLQVVGEPHLAEGSLWVGAPGVRCLYYYHHRRADGAGLRRSVVNRSLSLSPACVWSLEHSAVPEVFNSSPALTDGCRCT